jgi:1-acylglycerone phosphate reductase
MPSQHTKPVAVITGCSEPKSLGAAFARELLSRGWTVFATARKISTLEGLKGEGCEVSHTVIDHPLTLARS